MQKRLVISALGKIVMIIGASMILPLLTAVIYGEAEVKTFLICMPITLLVGFGMHRCFHGGDEVRVRTKDGFAIVTFGWIVASALGALPYMISGVLPNFIDAYFETMSGFTTTGASVISDVEAVSHGLLMWRALTHWLGGMGIIVLFVAILSNIGAGGMQIFKAEVPGPISEKIKPRVSDSAKSLWLIYAIFTGVQVVLLVLCGMSVFDAICHAFATTATGGFSTKNSSLGYYNNPAIEWVTIIFMFLAGANFALYYHVYRTRKISSLLKSREFRFYAGIVLTAIFFITCDILKMMDYNIWNAIRYAAFQVVSLITTTGFVTCDYEQWPPLAVTTLIFLLFIGGCAGSTSGGIKVDRLMILFSQARRELQRALHPRLVARLKVNAMPISEGTVINVAIFFFLYIVIVVVATTMIAGMGIDFMTAFSTVATFIGNVGPGLGSYGPIESFALAPYGLKIIGIMLMLLGRLEIYTVLVLFMPVHGKNNKKNTLEDL